MLRNAAPWVNWTKAQPVRSRLIFPLVPCLAAVENLRSGRLAVRLINLTSQIDKSVVLGI